MSVRPVQPVWRCGLSALVKVGITGFLGAALCGRADLWVTAYYPGWEQSALPVSAIDFKVVTHVIYFSLIPNADGTLNTTGNGITSAGGTSLISAAHAAGRKVIICVGGASSEPGFQGAAGSANRAAFINNLTNFMGVGGYDGIDLDWEPLPASDFNLFTNLVNGLRSAMSAFPSHKLLTVAAAAYPAFGDPPASEALMFASTQKQFDQINVMTYDLSGPYPGWVTWFNTPIYDGGYRFPSTGGLVPSVDGSVSALIANGVAASKLAIGIAFYGDVWSGGGGTSTGGAALPRQTWTNSPSLSQLAYSGILGTYYQSNLYHWDGTAQSAYLSIDQTGSANDRFISYDDAHTCQVKVSYARNKFLGGVMVWELAQAYFPTQAAGRRDPLLQTIKAALGTPRFTAIECSNDDVLLSFTALPLSNYRLLYSSDLNVLGWTTLTNNVPGTDGVVEINDPAALNSRSRRFYRVQTPP